MKVIDRIDGLFRRHGGASEQDIAQLVAGAADDIRASEHELVAVADSVFSALTAELTRTGMPELKAAALASRVRASALEVLAVRHRSAEYRTASSMRWAECPEL